MFQAELVCPPMHALMMALEQLLFRVRSRANTNHSAICVRCLSKPSLQPLNNETFSAGQIPRRHVVWQAVFIKRTLLDTLPLCDRDTRWGVAELFVLAS